MRVYIAAPWPLQRQADTVRHYLEALDGVVVTARWLDLPAFAPDSEDGARLCLEDIDRSDVVLLINPPEWAERGTGGRHFECGYALAKGKRIVIWGVWSNTFHRLHEVRTFAQWAHACEELLEASLEGRG